MQIRRIKVSEYFESVRDLAALHWRETESDFSVAPPELNLTMYRQVEDAGVLIALAAFDDGNMVGYVSGFVSRHPHYEMTVAQHDLLFVAPDFRKGRLGLNLMREFEREAREAGARAVFYHAKLQSQFDKLLGRLKFKAEEIVYRKDF